MEVQQPWRSQERISQAVLIPTENYNHSEAKTSTHRQVYPHAPTEGYFTGIDPGDALTPLPSASGRGLQIFIPKLRTRQIQSAIEGKKKVKGLEEFTERHTEALEKCSVSLF